jgi:uncharacterized protein YjiS (DUF1127 family)
MQHPLATPLIRGTGVAAALQRLLDGWAQRRLMHRRHAELQALDDRTLRDLGLHRSELLSLAAGADAGRSRRARA